MPAGWIGLLEERRRGERGEEVANKARRARRGETGEREEGGGSTRGPADDSAGLLCARSSLTGPARRDATRRPHQATRPTNARPYQAHQRPTPPGPPAPGPPPLPYPYHLLLPGEGEGGSQLGGQCLTASSEKGGGGGGGGSRRMVWSVEFREMWEERKRVADEEERGVSIAVAVEWRWGQSCCQPVRVESLRTAKNTCSTHPQ